MRITCIGVGNMGGAVARRLVTGGYEVTVVDPNPDAVARCVAAGARAGADATAAVSGAALVLTSLPLPEHVCTVWRGLAGHLPVGAIGMDVSTIDPATAETVRDLLAERDRRFVHCALGKTPAAAEQGAIPLFVGGDAGAIGELSEVFGRMGERVHDFGTAPAAAMFKLISNMVGMTNVAVLAEGYTVAGRAGIDRDLFAAALRDTGAFSFQSDVRLPWMLAEDDEPRFGLALAAKDVRLAVDAAARWNIPTPVSAQTLAQLLSGVVHGYGDRDVVALRRLLEPPT